MSERQWAAGYDEAAIEELLGAYALDACDPDEVAAVEALLERRPDLAREASRLSEAAAWIGASETLAAPAPLRSTLLGRARARRAVDADDGPARAYAASVARLDEMFDALDPDDHGEPTANGLSVRNLVVHLAAQESLFAQAIGASPVPDIDELEVDARTAAFVQRFDGRPLDDARDVWRRSVDAVRAWAAGAGSVGKTVPWLGLDLPRDNILVARAFENWIHQDDLRRATGRRAVPPPPAELHEMAELSVRTLPMALLVTGRGRAGKRARLVLTGPGGGEWVVPMGGTPPSDGPADVTLRAKVVEWCLVAGDRLEPSALEYDAGGDTALAADLVAAAPAFATL